MPASWPLMGRNVELERLNTVLEDGLSGGVVIAGAVGVGKTRLATEWLTEAQRHNVTVRSIAATAATSTIPLGVFASLLPELKFTSDLSQMLWEAARAIGGRDTVKRLVLLIDDAHLLDDTSAALTYQLVAGQCAFVVLTVRSGERLPEPVHALWKNGLAERVDLDPLTEAAVEDLLRAHLQGPVDADAKQRLGLRSGGNVLFLRELVQAAHSAGALFQERGVWHLREVMPASPRLAEIVEYRLGALSDKERAGLELLAFAEPLPWERFDALAGRGVVIELERRQLITAEGHGADLVCRLAHPLYGEVLRSILPAIRRRAICGLLAAQLAAVASPSMSDLLHLAVWQLEAGGQVDGASMLAAAETARNYHDLVLAERLAAAATAAGAGFPAALLTAEVLSRTGRGSEAETALAELAGQASSDAERGRLAITRVDNLCYNLGEVHEALTVATAATASIEDPAWRDELTAFQASFCDVTDQSSEALALAEPLLHRSTGRALIWACAMAGYEIAKSGRTQDAIEIARRGLEAHRSLTGPPMPWNASVHIAVQCFALIFAGQFHEAENLALNEFRRGVLQRCAETRWMMGLMLAPIYLAQGRIETAIQWARENASLARQHGRHVFVRAALISLSEGLALQGDADGAAAVLDELHDLPIPVVQLWAADASRAEAWTAAAHGDIAGARAILQLCADRARKTGDATSAAAALHDLARLWAPEASIEELAALEGTIDGDLITARVAHVRGLAEGNPPLLCEASAQFEAIGALLLAAECAAGAATAWRRQGETRKAAAAETRAAGLARRCEGVRTPTLAMSSTAQATLTGREKEVASLAVAGRSNKDIAEHLQLSVKTVENKLHAVYTKLGVANRHELRQSFDREAALILGDAARSPISSS